MGEENKKLDSTARLDQGFIGKKIRAYYKWKKADLIKNDKDFKENKNNQQRHFDELANQYNEQWQGSCAGITIICLTSLMIAKRQREMVKEIEIKEQPISLLPSESKSDKPLLDQLSAVPVKEKADFDDWVQMIGYFEKISTWDESSGAIDPATEEAFQRILSWLEEFQNPRKYYAIPQEDVYEAMEVNTKEDGILKLEKDFVFSTFIKDIDDLKFLNSLLEQGVFLEIGFYGYKLEEKSKLIFAKKNVSTSGDAHSTAAYQENTNLCYLDPNLPRLIQNIDSPNKLPETVFNAIKGLRHRQLQGGIIEEFPVLGVCVRGLRLKNNMKEQKAPYNLAKVQANIKQQRATQLEFKQYGVSRKTYMQELANFSCKVGDPETFMLTIKHLGKNWFSKNYLSVGRIISSAIKANLTDIAKELIAMVYEKLRKGKMNSLDVSYVISAAFYNALKLDKVEIYHELLSFFPDFRLGGVIASKQYSIDESSDETQLHLAARHLSTNALTIMKDKDSTLFKNCLNAKDRLGLTPLMAAVMHNKPSDKYKEAVKFLIKAGTNISLTNHRGATAFLLAVEGNHADVADLLLDRMLDQKKSPSDAELQAVARYGSPALLNKLVGGFSSLRTELQRAKTLSPALCEAARSGDVEKFKILCQAGADPTLKGSGNTTILDYVKANSALSQEISKLVSLDKLDEKRQKTPSASVQSAHSFISKVTKETLSGQQEKSKIDSEPPVPVVSGTRLNPQETIISSS